MSDIKDELCSFIKSHNPEPENEWKKMVHARKRHCFWIVLRKSNRCE